MRLPIPRVRAILAVAAAATLVAAVSLFAANRRPRPVEPAPREPVHKVIDRYGAAQASQTEYPPEHHAAMRVLLDDIPLRPVLEQADAEILLGHIRAGMGTRFSRDPERYPPGQKIPREIVFREAGKSIRWATAVAVAVEWMHHEQNMEPGVADMLRAGLLEMVDSSNPSVRSASPGTLINAGMHRDPAVRARIESLLNDPDQEVARVASIQLGYLKEVEALRAKREARLGQASR